MPHARDIVNGTLENALVHQIVWKMTGWRAVRTLYRNVENCTY